MKTKASHPAFTHLSTGFTLLEVLIALVILSIGLLGVAALQGVGLRSSHGAYLTSQASILAYDMADRIRANRVGFGSLRTAEEEEEEEEPPTPSSGTLAAVCSTPGTGASLEVADLAQWACSVQDLLPGGTGEIQRAINADSVTFTITVTWLDLQAENNERWNFQIAIDI